MSYSSVFKLDLIFFKQFIKFFIKCLIDFKAEVAFFHLLFLMEAMQPFFKLSPQKNQYQIVLGRARKK
jgi:hypothetical protein